MEFDLGRPSGLTAVMHQKIIDAVPRVYIQGQVADYVGLPRPTLSDWLKRGREDQKKGIESDYAILSIEYRKALADAAEKHLTTLACAPRNYQAIIWILEKCFKKDFGKDSEEYQKLVDLVFNQLVPMMSKGIDNGKKIEELDPESD